MSVAKTQNASSFEHKNRRVRVAGWGRKVGERDGGKVRVEALQGAMLHERREDPKGVLRFTVHCVVKNNNIYIYIYVYIYKYI